MLSLFKNRFRWSRHNGLIVVSGRGEVFVKGYKQTSERYAQLWMDAFKHCDMLERAQVRRVLMLGLAGGGALPAVHAAFPAAHVTAVEHDPRMIEAASELRAWEPHAAPEIVCDDAQVALEKRRDLFDLILVDIFYGIDPSPLLSEDDFWQLIAARLTSGGVALVNVAGSPEFLEPPRLHFAKSKDWRCDTNYFGAFWN